MSPADPHSVDVVKCDVYNLHEGDVHQILSALAYRAEQLREYPDRPEAIAYADRLDAIRLRVQEGSTA